MKKQLIRFLILLSVLTFGLLAVHLLIYNVVLEEPFPTIAYWLYAYFYLLTFIIHGVLLRSLNTRPQRFVTNFMGVLAVKMFVSLGVLLAFIYFNREKMVPFSVTFIVLYFAYTTLEVVSVLNASNDHD